MPYAEALELQRAVAQARISGELDEDVLLLVEHPPVVTLGRSAKERHLLASPTLLASRGVELFEVERGGDVTFHGPGQLVGYPIIDLKRHKRDLHWYLRQVEEALIRAIAAARSRRRAQCGPHRRVDRGAKDRIDRRARARLGDLAWLRPQRHDGSSLLRSHRAVRHRRGRDDLSRSRAGAARRGQSPTRTPCSRR